MATYDESLTLAVVLRQILTPDIETVYDKAKNVIGKTPTTLVRITLDTVTNSSQVAGIYLFSEKHKPLHVEKPTTARPYLLSDTYLGQEIQETITLTGQMNLIFAEDYTNTVGWWHQWRALNPYYLNRTIEVLKGFEGFLESEYKLIFKGRIKNMEFKADKKVIIKAKTLLEITDKEYPRATDGKVGVLVQTTGNVTLATGTDMTQYSSSGYIKIEQELIKYTSITNETFNVSNRGQFNADGWSSPTTHAVGKEVQQVIVFNDQNPMDIIKDLLVEAGLDATPGTGDIDNDTGGTFNVIKDNWFNGIQFRAFLDESKTITNYLKELKEACFLAMFENEQGKVAFSYLAPPLIDENVKSINDSNNIIFSSLTVNDKMDLQVTRVFTYYDLLGATSGSDPFDYQTATAWIDASAESNYKQAKGKIIRSRWLRSSLGADDFAKRIARNYTLRFKDGRKTVAFELETKDDSLQVGEIFLLSTEQIQDINGAGILDQPYYIIKKTQVGTDRWAYIAYDSKLVNQMGYIAPLMPFTDYLSASARDKQYIFISGNYVYPARNGDVVLSSPIVSNIVGGTGDLYVGMPLSGIWIPVSTTIISIDSVTQITMSSNATNTATIPITFTHEYKMSNGDDAYFIF